MTKISFDAIKKRQSKPYWYLLVGFIIMVAAGAGIVLFSPDANTAVELGVDETLVQSTDMTISSTVVATSTHPVAVMIDNHFDAWESQFGLSRAAVVYHTVVEGGATRFMALFDLNSGVDKIGPVRSARPYFLPWVAEYDALFVHVGGSPEALDDIQYYNITNINEMTSYGPTFFYRDDGFLQPHNTFTTTDRMRLGLNTIDRADVYGSLFDVFPIAESARVIGAAVDSIYIDYSSRSTYDVEYVWNDARAALYRYRAGEQQFDAATHNVLEIRNLILQSIPAAVVVDEQLRVQLDVLGRGDAIYIVNGMRVDGYWEKASYDSKTRYYTSDDELMRFVDSPVWIEVIPEGVAMQIVPQ